MDSDKIKFLLTAANAGEIVDIRYHGGSRPGEPREIVPKDIIDGDKLLAYCCTSKTNKTFVLSKIEVLGKVNETLHAAPAPAEPTSLQSLYDIYKAEWESMGWDVELNENSLKLYGHFKNGNRRKSPEYTIIYNEEIYDYTDFTESGKRADHYKKADRPWSVSGGGYGAQFKHADKAIDRFIEITSKNKIASVVLAKEIVAQMTKEKAQEIKKEIKKENTKKVAERKNNNTPSAIKKTNADVQNNNTQKTDPAQYLLYVALLSLVIVLILTGALFTFAAFSLFADNEIGSGVVGIICAVPLFYLSGKIIKKIKTINLKKGA